MTSGSPEATPGGVVGSRERGDAPGDVLIDIARRIAQELDVWECDLYEFLPDSDELLAVAVWSRQLTDQDRAWIGTRVAVAQRPTYAAVVRRRETRENYADDPALNEVSRDLMKARGECYTIHAPLIQRDQVIGALTLVERRAGRHFNDEDKRLLELLSVPAAVAIHNARLYREQAQRTRELTSLLDAIRAMTSTASIEDVLDTVAVKCAEALDVAACAIYEYEPEQDAIVLRAAYDAVPPGEVPDADVTRIGERFPLAEFPEDREIITSGEIVAQRLADPLLPSATRKVMLRFGEMSCLSVPLTFRGEPIGLLEIIESRHERRFSRADRNLAHGLGEQAGAAIHNARVFRGREEQNRQLSQLLEELRQVTDQLGNELQVHQSLLELSEDLLSLRDQSAVFGKIAAALRVLVSYDSMEISLVDEAADELVEVFLGEGSANETLGFRMPLGGGVAGAVTLSGHAEMINDMMRDPRAVQVPGTDQEEQSSIVAPLQVGGRVIGVLAMSRFGGARFVEREFELVKLITNLAAIAIWNSRVYGDMEEKAIHDGLTGLYNHRHFYERLGQEVARSQRYGTSLALLMIDLDDFKRYNDTQGHLAGDDVLKEIGRILQDQIRKDVDIVARYGGEEFAILLPNTSCEALTPASVGLTDETFAAVEAAVDGPSADNGPNASSGGPRRGIAGQPPPPGIACGARIVGERIREQVARREFGGATQARLTVSIGVALLPETAYDGYHLVQNADKALYLAKRLGKNRVEVFRR
jgi:GGDEF domain-containing protein